MCESNLRPHHPHLYLHRHNLGLPLANRSSTNTLTEPLIAPTKLNAGANRAKTSSLDRGKLADRTMLSTVERKEVSAINLNCVTPTHVSNGISNSVGKSAKCASVNLSPPLSQRQASFVRQSRARKVKTSSRRGQLRKESQLSSSSSISVNVDAEMSNKTYSTSRHHSQKRFGCTWSFVFDPAGQFSYWWSAVVSISFLYNFWIIPYRYAFAEIGEDSLALWFALDYSCDFLYLIDICVSFRTGYLDEGVLQTSGRKMRLHYMNSTRFYIDCLCMLPLDFLYLSLTFKSIVRVFRLVKVYQFWNFLDRCERHTNFPNVVRSVKLVHYLMAIVHWNACVFKLVSDAVKEAAINGTTQSIVKNVSLNNLIPMSSENAVDSGVYATAAVERFLKTLLHNNTVSDKHLATVLSAAAQLLTSTFNISSSFSTNECGLRSARLNYKNSQSTWDIPSDFKTISEQYLYALYWSSLTLTLMGDHPRPPTLGAFTFVISEVLFALLLFATVLGHVANIVANVCHARKDFQSRLDAVKIYLALRRVPASLQTKVIKWFDYLWCSNMVTDEEKTLSLLPDRLKAEIAIHVHLDTLKRVEIFQQTEDGFLSELVLRLTPALFSPGDYICRKGEVGKEMYIVNRGRLHVVLEDGKTVLATLRPGSYFGEISILNMGTAGNRRTASVKSVGYSYLFCLSKKDLWDVLTDYPAARLKLEAVAAKRVRQYNKPSDDEVLLPHNRNTCGSDFIQSHLKTCRGSSCSNLQNHTTIPQSSNSSYFTRNNSRNSDSGKDSLVPLTPQSNRCQRLTMEFNQLMPSYPSESQNFFSRRQSATSQSSQQSTTATDDFIVAPPSPPQPPSLHSSMDHEIGTTTSITTSSWHLRKPPPVVCVDPPSNCSSQESPAFSFKGVNHFSSDEANHLLFHLQNLKQRVSNLESENVCLNAQLLRKKILIQSSQ